MTRPVSSKENENTPFSFSSSSPSSFSSLFSSSPPLSNSSKKQKITVQTQITSIFKPKPSGSGSSKRLRTKESNSNVNLSSSTRVVILKKGNSSRGKLSLLPNLPLDLLFEIFGHLIPLDVLHLARTNKDLRRVLMHTSATTIWKAAFENVLGLPRCPNDMSYPAYASLVFENTCQNCQAQNVRTVDWYLQVRLCSRCAKTCLVMEEKEQKIELEKGGMHLSKVVQTCVPFSEWYREKGNTAKYCLQSVRERVLEEFRKCAKESVENLVEERKARLRERFEHAQLCNRWYESQKNNRAKEIEDIREKRERAIERRLIGMGYGNELYFLDTTYRMRIRVPDIPFFEDHPLIRQPKPLTERNWENICPKLQEYMSIVRTVRLKHERDKILWDRRSTITEMWHFYRDANFSPGEFLPNTVDLWLWSPMKTIIEQPNEVLITDITIKERYPDVLEQIPGFVKTWQEDKLQQLVRQLDAVRSLSRNMTWPWRANTRNLELARCVFTCSRWLFHDLYEEFDEEAYPCMFFPEFLFHPCNALCIAHTNDAEDSQVIEGINDHVPIRTSWEWEGLRRRQWSTRWLTFDEKASKTVENILDACGLSRDLTVRELEEADVRVVCLKCSYGQRIDGERYFSVMTWRAAVQHSMKKHWGDSQVTWQRIADEDVPKAKILEVKEPARRGADWVLPPERPWRCTSCRDKDCCQGLMTLNEMKRHHRKKHQEDLKGEVVEIKENVHYYRGLDKTPRLPYPVKMIPKVIVETPEERIG